MMMKTEITKLTVNEIRKDGDHEALSPDDE